MERKQEGEISMEYERDEYMTSTQYDGDGSERDERFVIDTPEKANWAIKTLKKERRPGDIYIDIAMKEIAEHECEIARLRVEIDRRREAQRNRECGLVAGLRRYMETSEDRRETKTQYAFDLPSGKLVLTKPKRDYRPDLVKLLAFAKSSAPQYVQTEESVKWGELKKTLKIVGDVAVTGDGMVVEGVEIVDVPAEFKII